MNSFNGIISFIKSTGNYIISVIYSYNFPALDPSLVLYYPLDVSGSRNTFANYASQLPVYDASLSSGTMITTSTNTFVNGVGDLSLNNNMGSIATNYVTSNKSFILNPSGGLSISCWFSCSGELGKTGTIISLYRNSNYPSIELDILGSTLISGYRIPIPPVTFSLTGGGIKSSSNSLNGNVNYVFTGNGNFIVTVPSGNPGCTLKVFLVGGGGGGGAATSKIGSTGINGGGGGAGQVIEYLINVSTTTNYTVNIGAGGTSNSSGSSTFFSSSYEAKGGGNGASSGYISTYGGGGMSDFGGSSSASSTGWNNTIGNNGISNMNTYSGGCGAGAGGNATTLAIGTNDKGGDGIIPSNSYTSKVMYGIGGPARYGREAQYPPYSIPASTKTLWRASYTRNEGSQFTAPNNTGHGGIGGGYYNNNNYDIVYGEPGGAGGSGICIVSIIS
jgi:hypothetical protein